ncbi:MAG: nucleoside-diphosphate-sugar epimerase [Candidatus Poriferisodalaceae bacterium]|jgi:nucleoside-diphosphate-sugar epimerase
MTDHYVITGGYGCIGVWAAKLLADEDAQVTIADITNDDHRLRLIAGDATRSTIQYRYCDLTEPASVDEALAGATHVIHLGALQVPFCRTDPRAGAAVNVGGTINVFETALTHEIEHVTWASSVAVYAPPTSPDELITDDTPFGPTTLYGGYKVANELNAAVYADELGLATIGLRPHTLYGPGRDQGLTSQPTQAIGAALRGERYAIGYGGEIGFQFAPDVAHWFIAAVRAAGSGPASVHNVGGTIASVAEFASAIESAVPGAVDLISYGLDPLPFPKGADDSSLRARLGDLQETPLLDGVALTADIFRRAVSSI